MGLTGLSDVKWHGAWLYAHSGHRFPAPSYKLWQNWLRHWMGILYLRAAVHRRGQRPLKGLGSKRQDYGSNIAPKHVRKHETYPPWVEKKRGRRKRKKKKGRRKRKKKKKRKKEKRKKKKKKKKKKKEEERVCLNSNDFGFILAGVSNVVIYKRNVWYNFNCLLQPYCQLSITWPKNCSLAEGFSRPVA